jgi:hypothetical protein
MLQLRAADTYQSYRFLCSETVRAAAVGGSEVILGVKAVVAGNQAAWLIRKAQVDGRELFGPKDFFEPPTDGEMLFVAVVGTMLFLMIGAFAVPGEPRRKAPLSGVDRKRR